MIKRLILILIAVPLAIIMIALAVANRGNASFTIDPFHPGNPALTVEMPLFVYLFAAVILGLMIGSAATWLGQGQHRRLARKHSSELRGLRETAAREKAQPAFPAVGGPR